MKPSRARDFARAFCVLLAVGCGGPAAPPAAAVSLPLGPASPPPAPAAPRGEAGPRAPENLALLVRVNDPEALARELASILPTSGADPRQLVHLLVGSPLGEVVDLTQPVDVASVGHEASFVVSLAVRSEAEARLGALGLGLREEGGLLRVGKADDAADAARMRACAFTAAAGRASTRLVCASDEATLEKTAKYLARPVAGEPFDGDVKVTLPGRILRDKRDGATKAIGDAASAHLGAELVERFVQEIDRIDAEVRFAGARVELGLELELTGRESMLSRVLVPRSRPATPPRAFYRLPIDSIFALHTTGPLPDDVAALRTAIAENLEAALVQDGYQAGKAHALRERIEGLVLTGGPLVLATGVAAGRDGAEKALVAFEPARAKSGDEAKAEIQVRAALTPWMLAQIEEPPQRWTQALRDIVRRAEEAERTRTPGSKASTPRDKDGDHVDVRPGTIDAAWRLPKDSLHLEIVISPRTKGSRKDRKGHLFVVPKGAATWLGYSEDASAITARLRGAIDDASDAGTLAKSPEAASLQTQPALAAGIGSLGGLLLLTARTSTLDDLRMLARKSAGLGALASHGAETLVWTAKAESGSGVTHVGVQVQATRQTATDFVRYLAL